MQKSHRKGHKSKISNDVNYAWKIKKVHTRRVQRSQKPERWQQKGQEKPEKSSESVQKFRISCT